MEDGVTFLIFCACKCIAWYVEVSVPDLSMPLSHQGWEDDGPGSRGASARPSSTAAERADTLRPWLQGGAPLRVKLSNKWMEIIAGESLLGGLLGGVWPRQQMGR